MHKQGCKCNAGLIGEFFNRGDPQQSTEVQRAWLPSKDASIAAYHKGKTNQRLEKDNELSLPIGEGSQATFRFSDQPGFYRRISQDVTILRNETITQK
jgi:hypothetical protein